MLYAADNFSTAFAEAVVRDRFEGKSRRYLYRPHLEQVCLTAIAPTTTQTGQQWDDPNGWAPLQWIAFRGLSDYGETDLARTIAGRWLNTVCRAYGQTGKLLEKYDVETAEPGGGGEYPLQDGFGWTNGVTRALLGDVPQPSKCAAGLNPVPGVHRLPSGPPPLRASSS